MSQEQIITLAQEIKLPGSPRVCMYCVLFSKFPPNKNYCVIRKGSFGEFKGRDQCWGSSAGERAGCIDAFTPEIQFFSKG